MECGRLLKRLKRRQVQGPRCTRSLDCARTHRVSTAHAMMPEAFRQLGASCLFGAMRHPHGTLLRLGAAHAQTARHVPAHGACSGSPGCLLVPHAGVATWLQADDAMHIAPRNGASRGADIARRRQQQRPAQRRRGHGRWSVVVVPRNAQPWTEPCPGSAVHQGQETVTAFRAALWRSTARMHTTHPRRRSPRCLLQGTQARTVLNLHGDPQWTLRTVDFAV